MVDEDVSDQQEILEPGDTGEESVRLINQNLHFSPRSTFLPGLTYHYRPPQRPHEDSIGCMV